MRILSIRQPWCTLIASGIKTVENRSWATHYRGPVYLHASKKSEAGKPDIIEYCKARGVDISTMEFPLGGIIGVANLNDCFGPAEARVRKSETWQQLLRWYEGEFGFTFVGGRMIDFIPSKGQLGLYYPDKKLLEKLRP
jgi:hypothetical protein